MHGGYRPARTADPYTVSEDLALEAHERVSRDRASELPGVDVKREEDDAIVVTRLTVKTAEGAEQMQKRQGTYTTLEVPDLRKRDPDVQKRVSIRFAAEFRAYIERIAQCRNVLVVGLGNWHVTPDSLGPQVVERLFITRHLFSLMPDIMDADHRSVCALAPGVLGLTGLETWEVVTAIAKQVSPNVIIAIDALASRSLERVNATIQIS
ncbi:MAG: GPR endopeptidase, partial [Firmicutes bacterium]|nr:GPR endopeptidase [Bacillota bacterium]